MNPRSASSDAIQGGQGPARAAALMAVWWGVALGTPAILAAREPGTRRQPEPAAKSPATTPNPAPSGSGSADSRAQPIATADDLAALSRSGAGLISRREAAARLILTDDPALREGVAAILRGVPTGGQNGGQASGPRDAAREVLLGAIASSPTVGDWVALALTTAAREAGGAWSSSGVMLAGALGSARTQAAARALVDMAATGPVDVRSAAILALRRMTGRDFGEDIRAWSGWLTTVEFLGEADWRRVLWEGLAQRADALASVADSATQRLVDLKRRDFLALPEAGGARSQLLASLLVDELAPLRRLGVDLARRELANGRVPDEFVVDSTVEMLGHPEAEFRGAAATLLAALAPAAAGDLVTEALLTEQSPTAAGAMLAAAGRWPRASLLGTVVSWLEADSPARAGAIEAAAALHRAGFVREQADRQRIARVLRGITPASMTETATWLLAQLGEAADRAYLVEWLAQPDGILRARAAEALASVPEGVEPVLAAAKDDPALFDMACRAVAASGATPGRLATLYAMPASGAEAKGRGLLLAINAAPLAQALAFASGLEPASLRESLLAQQVLVRARAQGLAQPLTPAERAALAEATCTLARTRLELRQPALALDALEALPTGAPAGTAPEPPDSPGSGALAIRVTSLAWLNRLDEALSLRGGPGAWLDALEYAIDLPHARAIADIVRHRYAESDMTVPQQARFSRLLSGLAAAR